MRIGPRTRATTPMPGSSVAGHGSVRARRRLAVGAVLLLGGVIGACGVPTGQDSFDRIGSDEVPFRLAEQSTTTTSTTVAPTTTEPATTDDLPTTSAEATTTTLPLETVAVYFLSQGELQPVPRELPQDYGINQLAAGLEAGPPEGSAGIGLDTLVVEGLILDSAERGGVVTVELDEQEFDAIQPRDLRGAMAQIVLTYTANLRGVGQVSFQIAGDPIRVPTGDGLLSEPGEPLSFDDYAGMLADRPLGADSDPPLDDDPAVVDEPATSENPTDEPAPTAVVDTTDPTGSTPTTSGG